MTSILPVQFDYSALPRASADELKEAAAYINTRTTLVYQLIVEAGAMLRRMKEKYEGVFMVWCASEFMLSHSTIENYMAVSERMNYLTPEEAEQFQSKALYKLAGADTTEAARQAAVELARKGKAVNYDTAMTLASDHEPLKQAVVNEEISPRQAAATVKATRDSRVPDPVRAYVKRVGVSDPEVVKYLSEAYVDYEISKDMEPSRRRTAWIDIQEENTLNGIGWSVPISQANARDVDRYRRDRYQRRVDSALEEYTTIEIDQAQIVELDGIAYIYIGRRPDLLKLEGVALKLRMRYRKEDETP